MTRPYTVLFIFWRTFCIDLNLSSANMRILQVLPQVEFFKYFSNILVICRALNVFSFVSAIEHLFVKNGFRHIREFAELARSERPNLANSVM